MEIEANFKLPVSLADRLHEFNFDMRLPLFNPNHLNGLSSDKMHIKVKSLPAREGLFNGIMDLFFTFQGKYYILDWKSNYLGDCIEDYGQEQLVKAMNENNYHLQYLLYTLGAIKYLKSRLPDFDYNRDFGGVVYLFVRGVREGHKTGIFTTQPSTAILQRLEHILYKSSALTVKGIPVSTEKLVQ